MDNVKLGKQLRRSEEKSTTRTRANVCIQSYMGIVFQRISI